MTTVVAEAVRYPRSGHAVRFYEGDPDLCEAVAAYLREGLDAGEATLVIATPRHRAGFARALQAIGVEVEGARARGQLVELDAEDTLSAFMAGDLARGVPDAEAFERVAAAAIERASARGRYPAVRAYGEMVAVLFESGNEPATIRLEELWNGLAAARRFRLCCGYLKPRFDMSRHAAAFRAICSLHSDVLPPQAYLPLAGPEEHHRQLADLQQRARAAEAALAERDALLADEQEARQAAEAAGAQAGQEVRLREDLIAVVSHDLRDGLNAILTGACLLQESLGLDDGAPLRRPLDSIVRAVDRLTSLVAELLEFAAVHSGRVMLQPDDHDVAALVEEALELLRPQAEAKRVRVRVEVSPPGLRARCDRGRSLQIIGNLASNALRFTPEGGEVAVRAGPVADGVAMFVSDTGPGLREDEAARVFEPYWQGNRASRAGAGLGLSIVRALAEAQGGRVWVERASPGATFAFTLPAPDPAA